MSSSFSGVRIIEYYEWNYDTSRLIQLSGHPSSLLPMVVYSVEVSACCAYGSRSMHHSRLSNSWENGVRSGENLCYVRALFMYMWSQLNPRSNRGHIIIEGLSWVSPVLPTTKVTNGFPSGDSKGSPNVLRKWTHIINLCKWDVLEIDQKMNFSRWQLLLLHFRQRT